MNLLMNAVDAMPAGHDRLKRPSKDPVRHNHVISDTGKGMDAASSAALQPFFTTKTGGTGLGLAISKRLIEEQGGSISIASSVGSGTTFTITIPCNRGKDVARDDGE
jgi:signal transduction histidine kinase